MNAENIINNNKERDSVDIHHYFITSIDELIHSVNNKEKHARYDELINNLGCNVDFFRELRNKPRIIFGEQPGSWLNAAYKQRAYILFDIINNNKHTFNIENSGIYTLHRDKYTVSGQKKIFQIINLGNLFNSVCLINKKFEEQNKGKIYNKIELDCIKDKMRAIFNSITELISLSDIDNINVFIKKFKNIISISNEKYCVAPKDFINVKEMLNMSNKDKLMQLFNTIKEVDKNKIRTDIEIFKSKLDEHRYWHKYWHDVNMIYFENNNTVRSIDKLFNEFILSIEDVDKLAHYLATITGHNNDNISLFGLVDNDIYYTVYYDFKSTDDKKFVCYKNINNMKEYKRLTWNDIKEKAKNIETGGPSLILEYLMMACAGIYIFTDNLDAKTIDEKDKLIANIHKKYIGIKYPWITFDLSDKVSNCKSIYPGSYSLFGKYHTLYNEKISKIINNFHNNGKK